MKEDFLHYLWRFRLYNQEELIVEDQSLQIIDVGQLNLHEGPDFLNAKIKIGETIWAGNIEIHIHASDWTIHKHAKLYDNVILHVVLHNDKKILRKNGEVIPVLEFDKYIDYKLYHRYTSFLESKSWIPCQSYISEIDKQKFHLWLNALAIERLERKSEDVLAVFKEVNFNWEETFYRVFLKYFGSSVNSSAFECLSKSIPYNLLRRHSDSIFQLEALLFGLSGLLNTTFTDSYPLELQKEYKYLQKKYSLVSIDSSVWSFFRIRPVAFPTIRIALLASLIYSTCNFFSKIIELKDVKDFKKIFSVNASEYWNMHYQFDVQSTFISKQLGNVMIESVIINAIVPLIFVYGKKINDEQFVDLAVNILEQIKPESNYIVRRWNAIGVQVENAFQSQALMQLQKQYCERKACLKCVVGKSVLS